MTTTCTRNLSFEQAQAMWPGVTLDPDETFTFRTEPMPAYETLAYTPVINLPKVSIDNSFVVNTNSITRGISRGGEAVKFDVSKTDWSLVPFEALEGMVRVLEFGAKKYSRDNWRTGTGFKYTRVINSLMRHLFSYMRGEDLDKESGLPHIAHIQCNALFLAYYALNKAKFNQDDR